MDRFSDMGFAVAAQGICKSVSYKVTGMCKGFEKTRNVCLSPTVGSEVSADS